MLTKHGPCNSSAQARSIDWAGRHNRQSSPLPAANIGNCCCYTRQVCNIRPNQNAAWQPITTDFTATADRIAIVGVAIHARQACTWAKTVAEAGMTSAFVVSRFSRQCLTTGMMPDANSPAAHHMHPETLNSTLCSWQVKTWLPLQASAIKTKHRGLTPDSAGVLSTNNVLSQCSKHASMQPWLHVICCHAATAVMHPSTGLPKGTWTPRCHVTTHKSQHAYQAHRGLDWYTSADLASVIACQLCLC